jgi:hypothetical protein
MSNAVKADTWFPRFRAAKTYSGAPPALEWYPAAASQTIVEGDPLTIDTSTGKVSIAVGTEGSASATILGVAAGNVTTTSSDEGTEVAVWVANRDTIFIGACDDDSGTLADGTLCDIISSGSGTSRTWKIDVGTQSTNVVTILRHVGGDSTSDTTDPGRVYFQFGKSSFDRLSSA